MRSGTRTARGTYGPLTRWVKASAHVRQLIASFALRHQEVKDETPMDHPPPRPHHAHVTRPGLFRIAAFEMVMVLNAVTVQSSTAHASDDDGVYGRLHADTTLSLEAGAGPLLSFTDTEPHVALATTFRARALDMTGAFLGYQHAIRDNNAIVLGIDLRPLVFARIFSDLEHGPRWLDLTIDSLGLELGTALLRPGLPRHEGAGLALVVGSGIDVPFAWSEGTGLLLRFAVRWLHAAPWDVLGPGVTGGDSVLFTLNLVGRTMVRLGLIHVR